MPDLETTAQLLGFLILVLLNIGRRIGREESPAGVLRGDQQDDRLRAAEQSVTVLMTDVGHLKARIEALHHKASDEGNRAQRLIGDAAQHFVSRRECDVRHGRE